MQLLISTLNKNQNRLYTTNFQRYIKKIVQVVVNKVGFIMSHTNTIYGYNIISVIYNAIERDIY